MDPFVAPPLVPLLGFAPLKASRLVRLRKTSTAFRVFIQYVAEYLALRNSAQDDTESVCAAVCGGLLMQKTNAHRKTINI